jgi:hypothetical protein
MTSMRLQGDELTLKAAVDGYKATVHAVPKSRVRVRVRVRVR